MKQCILVTVTGTDRPGITAALMRILTRNNYVIADMGQSVTHGLLSLSFLIHSPANSDGGSSPVLKDLLFEAKNFEVNLDFKIIETTLGPQGKKGDKFVLSCVSPENIGAGFMAEMANALAEKNVNISRIDNVTGYDFKSVEVTTEEVADTVVARLKTSLLDIGHNYQVDTALIKESLYRGNKRLIVFDMDSTFIQTEVIDEIAEELNVRDKVSEITERAMNGELDFAESLKERVSLLKGLDVKKLEKILERLPITEGIPEFLEVVKKHGYKTAIISGGFTYFANALKDRFNLDYAFANELEISEGKLTGQVTGTIVDSNQKATLVQLIAQQEGIGLSQVVAIGDGANDLPMLSIAGLGIAFHAKELVKKRAKQHLSFGPMTSILYFLGIRTE
ncbi:MAG: phosphoserine phosphatase SerB [Bacteriovoracaceae bacterium]|jgi:phosphoserine phosphatase|nr:phosphoserine phosphatase SerB [Bacteriovoracaceae bacterium]